MTSQADKRLRCLQLIAPGRLHLGFLDPAGTLGRRFGSLGLVIDGPQTVVELRAAPVDKFSAAATVATSTAQAELGRAQAHLASLRAHTGCTTPLHLHLQQVLPAHAGLGSGTQLALAIGRAFVQWHGLQVDSATLAGWLGRGRRSGIGISGFDQGGLLLDGGPGADGSPAPLLARLPFPGAWRVLLVQDSSLQGLSGQREKQAITSLPPLPQALAADICHQVLMRVLPGAASTDFAAFASGLTQVQALLGAHFAPAQGGSAYTSAAVGRVLQCIAGCSQRSRAGSTGEGADGPAAAIGQSSWGPTGFAILPSLAAAQSALAAVREAGLLSAGVSLQVVRGRNHGATLQQR